MGGGEETGSASRGRAAVQPSPDFPQGPLGSDHLVSSSTCLSGCPSYPAAPNSGASGSASPAPSHEFGHELAVAAGDSALGWRHRGWEEPSELRPSRGD